MWMFAGALVLVAVAVLFSLARSPCEDLAEPEEPPPYFAVQPFLTPAEANFFGILRLALGENFYIFAKVRLADVLQPAESGASGRRAFLRICGKHVDFVICRKLNWEIAGVIELDDASHRRSARVIRDNFLNHIFEEAGLPLIRVPVRESYSIAALRKDLEAVLKPKPAKLRLAPSPDEAERKAA